jgi:hypothetical protein
MKGPICAGAILEQMALGNEAFLAHRSGCPFFATPYGTGAENALLRRLPIAPDRIQKEGEAGQNAPLGRAVVNTFREPAVRRGSVSVGNGRGSTADRARR